MSATSPHVAPFSGVKPAFESELGSVTQLDAKALPILEGLAMKRVILEPGAIREPQWNANANQLAYCISGSVLVGTLGDADNFSSFVVGPGQMYYVESGAIYHIENVGETRAELILALRNEHPEHFSLRASFSSMTDAVLGNTYDLPASAFAAFDRSPGDQIVRREGPVDIPSSARLPNARFFDLQGQHPPLSYEYGHAHLARKQFWPALDDLSMYSLQINNDGMREPHWHPETAEMGYVANGQGRMRVLDPDGALDEYVLNPGDVYFIPRAFPHHIENVGEGPINFHIFFDQPTPGDIGYRRTASAYSREVLAASLGMSERDLPEFPFTPVDPLIVERLNPIDPVT